MQRPVEVAQLQTLDKVVDGAVYKYWAWCRTCMDSVVAVLTAVVDAAAFSSVDKQKLVALVQSRPSSNDDDDELSAPVVVACKSHSSNVVVVLSDLLDKAQTELDDTCHAESNAAHSFSMLQQSLRTTLHISIGL